MINDFKFNPNLIELITSKTKIIINKILHLIIIIIGYIQLTALIIIRIYLSF